jgi:ribosomal protein S18 acetylase RimI-like enzyme
MPASSSNPLALHVLTPEHWQSFRELRREALRDAPDAFSATLAEWSGDGDREEHWRARLTEVPFNVIAELAGEPAGMVSSTHPDENGIVLLISMWVAPFARGQGVGDVLVDAVLAWARQQGATGVTLAVRIANSHAVALYRRREFVDEGPIERDSPNQPLEHRMTYRLETP